MQSFYRGMTPTSRGVVASVVASALFAVLYALPGMLTVLSPTEIFAWRVVVTVPVLTVLVVAIGEWADVRGIARRIRQTPLLAGLLVADAALLGVQIWLFGWAPQTGHGLDVALGYFLMPLMMVLVGVTLHRERLSRLRIAAVAAAAIGVIFALLAGGGIGWSTVVVALGYPIYFTIRRAARIDSTGALWFELVILLVPSIVFAAQPASLAVVAAHTELIVPVLLLGVISAVALVAYILATRLLSFSLFGLLTYVEPVLLVVVAVVVLGEGVSPSQVPTYLAILVAIILLMVEGAAPRRPDAAPN
ncbi:EamA family transporter RarD [Glaciibacter psychrotolerans]|uniref:Chloramphenicol-sensitive protein RarD n=1 Tax=Glaciibacter psychrotolerans TaxID=670054 RepID=A0A7Z0EFI2_9MICO|nr:EamA family transporter RarD [Leifsonia psychrotolerans]NYJ20565.1 chloramphenicol-sensitive protein RarD [Leifsonia psychrotolerans]